MMSLGEREGATMVFVPGKPWQTSIQIDSDDEEEVSSKKGPRTFAKPPGNSSNFSIDLDREFSRPYREIWPFKLLNTVQTQVFSTVLKTDDNVVLAAPTGCGKTFIFELAVVRLLQQSQSGGTGPETRRDYKIIYLSPTKALAQQSMQNFAQKFHRFGLRVAEITGDSAANVCLKAMAQNQLIFTTPEKLDSLTRSWKDHIYLLGMVNLVLIDEVHFLGDDRGACLEAVVCRLKIIQNSEIVKSKGLPASKMRLMGVSATVPNIEDIAEWLKVPPNAVFSFGYETRPVPLDVHVLGFFGRKNDFLFNRYLADRVPEVLRKYSDGKSSLIFCESKNATETTAGKIIAAAPVQWQTSEDLNRIITERITISKLEGLLRQGIGYHHAGMSLQDRQTVEELFANRFLWCLCCTSTLAMGVNLPARLVIIKGTTMWRGSKSGYERLPVSSILQMIGRAGRPGLDTQGVAVIMTSKDSQQMYENLSAGQEIVESRLPKHLIEVINSEVSSGMLTDLEGVLDWLQTTYFFVRVQKNPGYYKMDPKNLKIIAVRSLSELAGASIVSFDEEQLSVRALLGSKVMSRRLMSFKTMKMIISLPVKITMEEMLSKVCEVEELCLPLRKHEKKILNDLLAKDLRFKPAKKEKVQTSGKKAFVLIQTGLQGIQVDDFALRMEQDNLIENGMRVLKAVEDYSVGALKGPCAYQALLLGRCLKLRMWETDESRILTAIDGIGEILCSKLNAAGYRTFDDIARANSFALDQCTGRKHPFGIELIQKVAGLLQSSLSITVTQTDSTTSSAKVVVQLFHDSENQKLKDVYWSPQKRRHFYTLVAYDEDGRLLLFRSIDSESPPPEILFDVKKCKSEQGEGQHQNVTKLFFRLISMYPGLDYFTNFYAKFGEGQDIQSVGASPIADKSALVQNVTSNAPEEALRTGTSSGKDTRALPSPGITREIRTKTKSESSDQTPKNYRNRKKRSNAVIAPDASNPFMSFNFEEDPFGDGEQECTPKPKTARVSNTKAHAMLPSPSQDLVKLQQKAPKELKQIPIQRIDRTKTPNQVTGPLLRHGVRSTPVTHSTYQSPRQSSSTMWQESAPSYLEHFNGMLTPGAWGKNAQPHAPPSSSEGDKAVGLDVFFDDGDDDDDDDDELLSAPFKSTAEKQVKLDNSMSVRPKVTPDSSQKGRPADSIPKEFAPAFDEEQCFTMGSDENAWMLETDALQTYVKSPKSTKRIVFDDAFFDKDDDDV